MSTQFASLSYRSEGTEWQGWGFPPISSLTSAEIGYWPTGQKNDFEFQRYVVLGISITPEEETEKDMHTSLTALIIFTIYFKSRFSLSLF